MYVVLGMSREAGSFAPQLSMGGAVAHCWSKALDTGGGSMKVQIRKYDGIGCGAQEARLV